MSSVPKIIGVILIAGFLAIGVLSAVKQPLDSKTVQDNTLAKAYLDKNKDQYAKCKNSLGLGKTEVYQVTRSYMTADTTEAQDQRVRDIEAKFIKKIEDECNPTIQDYEANFKTYKTTTIELAQGDKSLLDGIIGIDKTPDESDFFEYQPSAVALLTGSRTGESLVFSEIDIKDFYRQEIGR